MSQPDQTNHFFSLTPELVLTAVERLGYECTGRCLQLNSMENRVYEVEIELSLQASEGASVSDRFRVVKFYRPQRWTKEQIAQEHQFLLEAAAQDLTVIPPLVDKNGETIHELAEGFFYTLWPRKSGRNNPELNNVELETIGRLLGRLHNIGAAHNASNRLCLTPTVVGRDNTKFLIENNHIPSDLRAAYSDAVENICSLSDKWFDGVPTHRIHGDCHVGNVVWVDTLPYLLDFDDMMVGPAVQDIWLVVPGRDDYAQQQRDVLLTAYESFREFDWNSLRLIEPLRALRYIHFSTWLAKRQSDPFVKKVFPHFGTQEYWREQVGDLHEQLQFMHRGNF
jgi:Ser/Thr protein kinase RdoA (MazF antagonist)